MSKHFIMQFSFLHNILHDFACVQYNNLCYLLVLGLLLTHTMSLRLRLLSMISTLQCYIKLLKVPGRPHKYCEHNFRLIIVYYSLATKKLNLPIWFTQFDFNFLIGIR